MAKMISKKVGKTIVKLRDVEHLSWAAIGQRTGLHRDTVKKHYLLQRGEGVSLPFGQTALKGSSVKLEFDLLVKRQSVLRSIDTQIAVVEDEEWDHVEEEVLLLKERLMDTSSRSMGN